MVMAAVAKRLIVRLTAATQRNNRSASETESVSSLIANDNVVAHYAKRAVVSAFYNGFVLIAHRLSTLSFQNSKDCAREPTIL